MSSALTKISGNLATGTGLGDDGTSSTEVVVRLMSLIEIRVAKTDTGGSIAKAFANTLNLRHDSKTISSIN
jgi:hypothetical protein